MTTPTWNTRRGEHEPDPDEIALDEAVLTTGPLYEIDDPCTGRVMVVRDALLAAFAAAELILAGLAEQTALQLAANGEGHRNFPVRVHIRDIDTGDQPRRHRDDPGRGIARP